jgi:16S rRNA A1518/A1519 N6-dimethyltransferase RsmA/KsgA/DIM1 with predicted DNA glycosylase/AP lyase activity
MPKFDQHFLVSKEILNKIAIIINPSSNDKIFEIGAGKGFLTKELLKFDIEKLTSVEIDFEMIKILKTIKSDKFELLNQNALEIDFFGYNKVIGNIPYGITEALYEKILTEKPKLCVFLQGKKFTDTILNREQSKWYYFVNAFYEFEEIEIVEGKHFSPPAGVKSSIVKMVLKEKLSEEDLFFQHLFSKSERNTLNAFIFTLVDTHKITKTEAKKLIDNLDIEINNNEKLKSISNHKFVKIIESIRKASNL